MSAPELPPFDHQPKPYDGPSFDEVMALRKKYLTPSLLTFYKNPMMIVEGKMQYVYDEKGKRYLDGYGGIATVGCGHCHPHVTGAVVRQVETLQHSTTIYLHPTIAEYGKMLADKMPDELSVCYITNSGSEANDLAVMMARLYTGNYDVIALRNAYHGGVASAMGLTAHGTWKYNLPHAYGIQHAVVPDPYRGAHGDDAEKYAADVKDLIDFGTPGCVAAFIAESIQGVGGVVQFPDGYLSRVYDHVRAAGGLCIADEVQAGFGRTGEHFWGFQAHGVTPDIVTIAKSMGNGAPIAAVVTRPEIAEALTSRIHFNTFAGNPVSCAAAKAVLEVIDGEGLQANAKKIGGQILEELGALMDKYACIGQVRGMGLMLGMELVNDRATKEPATELTAKLLEHTKENGLLLGKGGLRGNVIRIKPPMCIHEGDADFVVNMLDHTLSEIS